MIDIPQTFRYSVVSGICLLFVLVLIPLLSWLGLHYAIATAIVFCLNVIVGFLSHCYWTFGVERKFSSFVRYVAALSLNLPLTIGLIGVGHDLLGLSVAISTALASALMFVWNYVVAHWAVLRRLPGAPQ